MCVLDFKPLRASDFPIGNKNDFDSLLDERIWFQCSVFSLSGRGQKILLRLLNTSTDADNFFIWTLIISGNTVYLGRLCSIGSLCKIKKNRPWFVKSFSFFTEMFLVLRKSFFSQKEWENQSPQRAMKSELHRGVKPLELHEARTRIVKSVWTIELIMFSTWETQNNCSKLLFEFLKVSGSERDWKSAVLLYWF